jgi:ribosomal protein S18 acetylase RimI-like enzyme
MRIRRATRGDAAALTAFGRRVFGQTFEAGNDPGDLAAYLDESYVEARQQEELADPAIETWLLEDEEALIAFAQLRDRAPGAGVPGAQPIELWRFYVDFAWHGRGAAQTLMAAVEEAARARGGSTLWLGVWERNVRAQAFYRKQGFTVVGSQIFSLGNDPQRDLVMAKTL